jgi:hypothetical protein
MVEFTATLEEAQPFTVTLNSVGIADSFPLADLTDVSITSLTDNQFLQYNSGTSTWENVNSSVIEDVQWGDVTGTLADQTDLQAALGAKLESGDNVSELVNDSGYITSYTETDTLQTVTDRGSVTINGITALDFTTATSTFSNNGIRNNTSDSNDDSTFIISGGGASGPTRGSDINVFGNEEATFGGSIIEALGDVAGAKYELWDGSLNPLLSITPTTATFTYDVTVPDEVYGAGWDASLEVPTKNAIYDKIESIPTGITDHGALTGLSDDDHAQYAKLTGRAGSQVLMGGTGVGESLKLIANTGLTAISFSLTNEYAEFIPNGSTQGEFRFREVPANGTNYVGLKGPASTSSDVTYSLPSADGSTSDLLQTDGAGIMSWTTLQRGIQIIVIDFTTDIATGDGKAYFHIDNRLSGLDLIDVQAEVITAGTTGTTDIQIHNVTQASDMLSTKITIDSTETGSDTATIPAVIDVANAGVVQNDLIRIDVDAVSTTPPKGLIITLGLGK